jgi:hypothetical protein
MGITAPSGVDASGLPAAGDQANAVLSGSFVAIGPSQPFAFRGPMNLAIFASLTLTLTTVAGSLNATVSDGSGLAAGAAINSVNVPRGTTVGSVVVNAITLKIPAITLQGVVSTSAPQISGLPDTTGLVGATVAGPGIPAGTTVLAILTPAVAPTNVSPGVPGVVQISNLPTVAPAVNYPQQFYTFARTGNAITVGAADAAALFTGAGITFNATVQLERSFDGGATFIACNIGAGALAQFTGAAVTPVNLTFGEPEKNVLYRFNCLAWTSGTINFRISQTGGAAESLAIGPLSSG